MSSPCALLDVVAYLDDLLQVGSFDEEDLSNGLMIDCGRPVRRIAAALNTSFTSIRGAAEAGADLLLVHHTTWASIDLHLKELKEEALRDAGISLYAAHSPLDCHPRLSPSSALARRLGVEIEGRMAAYYSGQCGVYGRVAGTFADFVEKVRAGLGVPVDAWENGKTFGRVGVFSGCGGRTTSMDEARSLGCDTYLTGEGGLYSKLFARETGMNLVLATHYGTEMHGIRALGEQVSCHLHLPWSFIREDPDIL